MVILSADHMAMYVYIFCTEICWCWSRIVGVIWKCSRGLVFFKHSACM